MRQDEGLTRSVTRVLLVQLGNPVGDEIAQVVARSLRDLGVDVVYGGLQDSLQDIVQAAMQEDVDVVGVQLDSGNALDVSEKIGDQLSGIKVVQLAPNMTVEEAVTVIKEAGAQDD